jgi:hypothetical protein
MAIRTTSNYKFLGFNLLTLTTCNGPLTYSRIYSIRSKGLEPL